MFVIQLLDFALGYKINSRKCTSLSVIASGELSRTVGVLNRYFTLNYGELLELFDLQQWELYGIGNPHVVVPPGLL